MKSRRFTPFLVAAVTEVSTGIGDAPQIPANLSRVANLMRRCGLDEPGMVAMLYHAHSLYKDRVKTGIAPVRSGGAYYFSIVEDLLPSSKREIPSYGEQTPPSPGADGTDGHQLHQTPPKSHPGAKLATFG